MGQVLLTRHLMMNIGGWLKQHLIIAKLLMMNTGSGWQNPVAKRFQGKILLGKVLLVQRSMGENVLSRFPMEGKRQNPVTGFLG